MSTPPSPIISPKLSENARTKISVKIEADFAQISCGSAHPESFLLSWSMSLRASGEWVRWGSCRSAAAASPNMRCYSRRCSSMALCQVGACSGRGGQSVSPAFRFRLLPVLSLAFMRSELRSHIISL